MDSKMTRDQVVQSILDLFADPEYLEIGVNKGETFGKINCHRKVAVDPNFLFDKDIWAEEMNNAEFHQVTSDIYFESCDEKFDLIYLDGLHTFEQTLRDFCNAISCLKPGGAILIDDTIPNSYHAAMPDLQRSFQIRRARNDKSGSWMGDVYRLVYFIDNFFQQWTLATLVENHGQTLVWQNSRPASEIPNNKVSVIASLPYEEVYLNKRPYRRMLISDIIKDISSNIENKRPL